MQIGVLKWLQFTKQKGVHFPMQFLEPKNKNAKSVDWEISEQVRVIVKQYVNMQSVLKAKQWMNSY